MIRDQHGVLVKPTRALISCRLARASLLQHGEDGEIELVQWHFQVLSNVLLLTKSIPRSLFYPTPLGFRKYKTFSGLAPLYDLSSMNDRSSPPACLTSPQPPFAHSASTLNGAQALIDALVELDVEVVFGYPGGAVLPIYDALYAERRLRHVLVRHEQAAVHAAEGYARTTGKPGVVLVTSGPGVSNTITGLLDAMSDSVPVVCISGQVSTA